MKVLLLDNVSGLGVVGDIVEVKRGYAVNYLLPRRLGVMAKDNVVKAHEVEIESARKKMMEQKEKFLKIIDQIDGQEYKLEKKVNKDMKMFGSVSQKDIEDVLAGSDIDWESIEVDLSKVQKDLAKYSIELKMPFELKARIVVNVVAKK